MNNKYYVINNEIACCIIIAKFSLDTGHFYDYQEIDGTIYPNINFALGQSFYIHANGFISTGDECNGIILNAIRKMQEYENLKEKNRPDPWPNPEAIPDTNEIIASYFAKKVQEGEKIDSYVVDIIYLLAKPMGLKLSVRHSNNLYTESGFDYREDIEDIIGAMYQIISSHLQNNNLPLCLALCNHGKKGQNYTNFTRQIELLTGFPSKSITSDLKYHQDASIFKGNSYSVDFLDSFDNLIMCCPRITIEKEQTIYEEDYLDPNSYREIIKSQLCEEVEPNFPRGRHIKPKEGC